MSGVSIEMGTMWRLSEDFNAARRFARDRFTNFSAHHHHHHHRHYPSIYNGMETKK